MAVGQEAFAVIREAMARKDMAGLGKVVISRRERIVMLEPLDQGLMATTLRYAYEVRDAKPYFEDIPPMKLPSEMIELAEHILETKAGHFDPAGFEDRYENTVVELTRRTPGNRSAQNYICQHSDLRCQLTGPGAG